MTSESNTGWQCPLCKTVYSPSVTKCDCAKVNVLEGTPYNQYNNNGQTIFYPSYQKIGSAPSQHYDFELCKYIND